MIKYFKAQQKFVSLKFKRMISNYLRKIIIFLCVLLLSFETWAQGINTTFGQNRVEFDRFEWSYVRSDNFDSYYYTAGREMASFAIRYAEENLHAIETQLDHSLSGRVEIICYNSLSEYKQGNFDLEELAQNTGGYTAVNNNQIYVYFNGDHADLARQIKSGLALVLLNEILYGGNIQDRIQNAVMLNLPAWYIEGICSYFSQEWSTTQDNLLHDLFFARKRIKFNRLIQKDPALIGHSFWRFGVEKNGKDFMANLVYITRLTRNYENAIQYLTGLTFKQFCTEWIEHYKSIYEKEENGKNLPLVELKIKRRQSQYLEPQIRVSPKGNYLAFTTNKNGKYKVWLMDLKTHKTKKILKGGIKYNQLEIDHSFPLICWQKGGDKIAMVFEKKGEVRMRLLDITNHKKDLFHFPKFDKITGIDYSDNGRTLVMSAIRKGQSDLFYYDMQSRRERQLTNDFYDDKDPRFCDYSENILFSSNRPTDSLQMPVISRLPAHNNFEIYRYNTNENKTPTLTRLTHTAGINESAPLELNRYYYGYLTDYNGTQNRYAVKHESEYDFTGIIIQYTAISEKSWDTIYYDETPPKWDSSGNLIANNKILFKDSTWEKMDTFIINKDILYTYPMSNYLRSTLGHDVSIINKQVYDLISYKQKYYVMISGQPKDVPEESHPIETYPTMNRLMSTYAIKPFVSGRKEYSHRALHISEPANEAKDSIELLDTSGYFFISDFTPMDYKKPSFRIVNVEKRDNPYKQIKLNTPKFYDVTFFADEVVTQLDNSIINTYYKPISPAAAQMFNSGLTGMFKIGMIDLFHDYRLTAGFRLSVDLSGLDYFLSYENLKRKWDQKWMFYRQSRSGNLPEGYIVRNMVHEARYQLKIPFNQTSSFRISLFGRQDRDIVKSLNLISLNIPDQITNWAGFKGEYDFDYTIPKGLNLWNGTRLKVFYEKYVNIDNSDIQLNVLGFDVRHYEKIHRQIIWASRYTMNTSFGPAKVLYILGGVENWLNPTYNNSNSFSSDQTYAFQALACNLRGFNQNIRNGNSFISMSQEIRIPLFVYLLNRPIRSEFINHFQIVPFFDLGTAWIGNNPYSDENTFNQKTYEQNPIKIKVINVRDPLVAGYGAGLRSKLMGYFIRFDAAWGIQDLEVTKDPCYYLSIGTDF